MAFKRALWSSGYEYRVICPQCRTAFSYRDNQLDFRPWYPNGFIYCPRCRQPFRHNEIYAVKPDGSRVYTSQAEANSAINIGYYGATGISPEQIQPQPQPQPAPNQTYAPDQNVVYCSKCGRPHTRGVDVFCSSCGNKLE